MAKFEVIVKYTGTQVFHVEAENKEEARESVMSGNEEVYSDETNDSNIITVSLI